MRDKKKLIEAALFIAARPMTLAELYHVVAIPKPTIRKLLKEMEKEYDDHGLSVRERDSFFELHIKDEYKTHVEHLAPEKDFSKATLQTLSLIAYHNPVKQSFIIETRGNRAYDHIKELSGRGFIRLEPEGHTNRIHITKKFLDYFNLTSPSQLKEYFSDRGVEPPDEESFEENVKKSEEKEHIKDSAKIIERPDSSPAKEQEPPTGSKEPRQDPEPPLTQSSQLTSESGASAHSLEPDTPKESPKDIERNQENIVPKIAEEKEVKESSKEDKEPASEDDPKDSGQEKKQKKIVLKKKSVSIKDEPYKSPFSDVLKDDKE